MVERTTKQSHPERQPDALREALLHNAKAHYNPSASQLAALVARLEPHLQTYESTRANVQPLHTRRWLRAVGVALPAFAAAILPLLYLAPNAATSSSVGNTAAPTSVATATVSDGNPEHSPPVSPRVVVVEPPKVVAGNNTASRPDALRARGNLRAAAPAFVRSKLELPNVPPLTDAQQLPPNTPTPPLEVATFEASLLESNTRVSLPPLPTEPAPPHQVAPPPGRYGAMQALAVHSPMFPRPTEVHVQQAATRALPSPSELSPRMSAAASTVAPWTL